MLRELQLDQAFILIEPGPVVLVSTFDGEELDFRRLKRSEIPPGVGP